VRRGRRKLRRVSSLAARLQHGLLRRGRRDALAARRTGSDCSGHRSRPQEALPPEARPAGCDGRTGRGGGATDRAAPPGGAMAASPGGRGGRLTVAVRLGGAGGAERLPLSRAGPRLGVPSRARRPGVRRRHERRRKLAWLPCRPAGRERIRAGPRLAGRGAARGLRSRGIRRSDAARPAARHRRRSGGRTRAVRQAGSRPRCSGQRGIGGVDPVDPLGQSSSLTTRSAAWRAAAASAPAVRRAADRGRRCLAGRGA
jgi:hypothetical protein